MSGEHGVLRLSLCEQFKWVLEKASVGVRRVAAYGNTMYEFFLRTPSCRYCSGR
jgi:hypothetical protein